MRNPGYQVKTTDQIEVVSKINERVRTRMRLFRLSNKVTHLDLCNMLCLSGNSGWMRIEYGKELNLRIPTLAKIALVMGISVSELLSPLSSEK